jgi:hypothetical protein
MPPCPLCAAPVPESARSADAVCAACVDEPCDASGQRVVFGNISRLGTGFGVRRIGDDALGDSPRGRIRGVECRAAEACLGGIVVRPVRGP